MEIIIQKYGGSSVATAGKIRKVAKHIVKTAKDKRVVVVVSAMGKTTNQLARLASKIYGGEPPTEELDKLLVTGEAQSAPLLAMAIMSLGRPAVSLTGWEIGLEADSNRRVKRIRGIERIKEPLSQGKVVVVAGFQGVIEGTGQVITLGRGGSDLTAIVSAAALGLSYCEIYTDVDGVYTIDPRIVPGAKRYSRIIYRQMIDLSTAGAEVLMDRSVALAQMLGVEIKVLLSPSFGKTTGGTLVCSGGSLEDMENAFFQPGVAIQQVEQVKISDVPNEPGMAAAIFDNLRGINIWDGSQVPGIGKTDIALVCLSENTSKVLAGLHKAKEAGVAGGFKISEPLKVYELTLADPLMKEGSDYLWKILATMGRAKVNVEMWSTSGTTIMVVVKEEDLKKAALALAEEFNLIS